MNLKTTLRVFLSLEVACIAGTLIVTIFGDSLLPAQLQEFERSTADSRFSL